MTTTALVRAAWIPSLLALTTPWAAAQEVEVEPPEVTVEEPAEASEDEVLPPPRSFAPFQADWGLAAAVRTAGIPYKTENRSVSSFVPMMFYEGDRVFIRGMSGGVRAWRNKNTEVNLVAGLRFVDIPAEYQNEIQGDTTDFGLQVRRDFDKAWFTTDVMSDSRGNWYVNGRVGSSVAAGKLLFTPSVDVRYLSSDFTTRYYALTPVTGQTANGAFQVSPSVTGRYHLFSDLFLVGNLRYTWFSSEISGLNAIDSEGVAEATLGFGFFQDAGDPQFMGNPKLRASGKKRLEAKPYVRLAHGWASESDLGDLLGFDHEKDEFDNQMTSAFYGHPLSDRLFGAPIEVFLSPGVAVHHASEVQNESLELVLKIKAYYTIKWPIRWRLGVAEGISWIDEVTYIEGKDMEAKGYRPSQLMNYLDFSLDLNVGDIISLGGWDRLWAGVAIHHRSSIFESASQFGRIKGGSNYPSLYLQYDLY